MNESIEHLCEQLKDPKARYVYADGFVNAQVAAQIKTNRETRDMSQQDLADAIGTKQSGISRLENVNYSSWKVESLRKLARAFGLWLDISFREFGELPSHVENFNRETLVKRGFEEDPKFAEPKQADVEAVNAYWREASIRSAELMNAMRDTPLDAGMQAIISGAAMVQGNPEIRPAQSKPARTCAQLMLLPRKKREKRPRGRNHGRTRKDSKRAA